MITASAIRAALALYDGWTYAPKGDDGVRRTFYPAESRMLANYLPQAGPRHTDCCTYVEGIALAAAWRSGVTEPWSKDRHARAMINDPTQAEALKWLRARKPGDTPEHTARMIALHGLPDELIDAGLAVDAVSQDYSPAVGDWWAGQLWERDWSSGHTVLVEGRDESVIVYEASKSAGKVIAREVTPWPIPGWGWYRWARLLVEQ